MDNKKFEQLIDLIINENEEQARELFHEIVVEKSREIYESIMDEEMMGGDQMVGEVGDLMDEINAEEAGGMTEADEEMELDAMDDDGDEEVEIDADDVGEEDGEVEDAVIRIEDKLDQLMAEFEQIMGGEGDGEDVADMGDDEGDEKVTEESEEDMMEESEEDMMEASDEEEDMDESVMEAVTLKKVGVTHGDNGAQTKSPGLQNSGQAGMDSKPVKFAGDAETVPTGPKGQSTKDLPGAGKFKNAPAQASQDLEKAPAPKKGDDGANTKSPVAESKKIAKKIVK